MALPSKTEPTRLHSEFSFVIVAPLETAPDEEDEPNFNAPTHVSPGTGILLDSVTDVSGGPSTSGDEWYSMGSVPQMETEKMEHAVSLTMLRSHSQEELALVLGYSSYPIGTKLEIQPDNKVWINIQHYISAGSGTIVGDEVWKHVQWNDLQQTQSADGYAQYVLSGLASDVYEKFKASP